MNAVDPELADHANAIAYVTKAVTDLADAQAIIGQLRADLHRSEDRVEMLVGDRDRLQSENNLFRNHLIELATNQSNIGLLTIKAQSIVMTVNELLSAPKPPNTPALEVLEQEFKQGNEVTE